MIYFSMPTSFYISELRILLPYWVKENLNGRIIGSFASNPFPNWVESSHYPGGAIHGNTILKSNSTIDKVYKDAHNHGSEDK